MIQKERIQEFNVQREIERESVCVCVCACVTAKQEKIFVKKSASLW